MPEMLLPKNAKAAAMLFLFGVILFSTRRGYAKPHTRQSEKPILPLHVDAYFCFGCAAQLNSKIGGAIQVNKRMLQQHGSIQQANTPTPEVECLGNATKPDQQI